MAFGLGPQSKKVIEFGGQEKAWKESIACFSFVFVLFCFLLFVCFCFREMWDEGRQ